LTDAEFIGDHATDRFMRIDQSTIPCRRKINVRMLAVVAGARQAAVSRSGFSADPFARMYLRKKDAQ